MELEDRTADVLSEITRTTRLHREMPSELDTHTHTACGLRSGMSARTDHISSLRSVPPLPVEVRVVYPATQLILKHRHILNDSNMYKGTLDFVYKAKIGQ